MQRFKAAATRAFEIIDTAGFALIVFAVMYFIIGFICNLVGGHILDYTFCGSAHTLIGVEWCGLEGHTGEAIFDQFVHKLMNVTLPWFMIFCGFIMTGISALMLRILGYQYVPPSAKDLQN
jgi:hypothetical protein